MGRLKNIYKHSTRIINNLLPNEKIDASKITELTLEEFNRGTLTDEMVDEIIYQHIYRTVVTILNSNNFVAIGGGVYQDIDTIKDEKTAIAIKDGYLFRKISAAKKLKKINKVLKNIIDGQYEMDFESGGYKEYRKQA